MLIILICIGILVFFKKMVEDHGRFKVIDIKDNGNHNGEQLLVNQMNTKLWCYCRNPITQDSDPGRFGVESEGYYTFTVDIDFEIMNRLWKCSMLQTLFNLSSITLTDGNVFLNQYSEMNQVYRSSYLVLTMFSLVPGEVLFQTNTGDSWGGDNIFFRRCNRRWRSN